MNVVSLIINPCAATFISCRMLMISPLLH